MKTSKTLATAGLILSLTLGLLAANVRAGSMVEAALTLANLEKSMVAQLNNAPTRVKEIVNYALSQKGKKVGGGQCTDLVNAALAASKSQPGNFADYRNYDWGTKRADGAPIKPGDIIQFEQAKFVTTTTKKDGSTSTSESTMDHHTAIVRAVFGRTVVLLHQNLDGSPVMQTVLKLDDIKAGRYSVWMAEAKPSTFKNSRLRIQRRHSAANRATAKTTN